jgi:hypothetical protein
VSKVPVVEVKGGDETDETPEPPETHSSTPSPTSFPSPAINLSIDPSDYTHTQEVVLHTGNGLTITVKKDPENDQEN